MEQRGGGIRGPLILVKPYLRRGLFKSKDREFMLDMVHQWNQGTQHLNKLGLLNQLKITCFK